MFKLRTLAVLGAALMLVGCNQPANNKAADDGMDYDQETDPVVKPFEMYIVGSHWTWTPAEVVADKKELCQFSKVEGTAKLKYEFDVTKAMVDEWFGFKFVAAGSWAEQYGLEDLDIESCNAAFKELVGYTDLDTFRAAHKEGKGNRSNVTPSGHAEGGHFVITYDPLDFRTATTEAGGEYTYHFVIDYTAPQVA